LLPTNLLSKITREKVTVSLSGDAGDELFGGYDTYKAFKIAQFIPGFFIKSLKLFSKLIPASDKDLHFSFKLKKFIQDWDNNVQWRHLNWMSQASEYQRENLLKENYQPNTSIVEIQEGKNLLSIQLNDMHHYLSNDILRKVDLASMARSLEVRVPFLDYRLVPLALSLSDREKIRCLNVKYLLKNLASVFLPKQIINRKKSGFSVPLSLWFKQSKKMQERIKNKEYYQHQLFDFEYAQELLNQHINGKKDNSRILWLLFVFNSWYKQNFVEKNYL
jgi:asparagine synthase (glutamine-hydrolysing)